ncbi:MAG: PAS domain S-box protein [Paracoccaceae bacterium]
MNTANDSLFLFHPDPMWVYDLDTLRFLAVNNAAVARYGYSQDEFLAMTIADIRPEEDRLMLQANVKAVTEGRSESGVWRHRLKSGEIIHVDITGHTVDHDGRRAELIAARDVSRFVIAEQTAKEALAREEIARQSSERLARQFKIMFDSVPGMCLVFSPDSFDVVAVSDAYLEAVGLTRSTVVGHKLFDALPVQPSDSRHAALMASFERVVDSGKPDLLDVQSVRLPDGTERHWIASNTPVNGPDKKLVYLILRIQDVTEALDHGAAESELPDGPAIDPAEIDLVAHTHALKSENIRLCELATRLRTTQRLLGTGTWDYVINEDRLDWSDNIYDMYGVTRQEFGHRLDDYEALVHPDDRAQLKDHLESLLNSDDIDFSLAHRILRPDGRVVHVRGMAEKAISSEGPVLRGVVQDETEAVESARNLAQAKRMLEIAGHSAKFGAWQYDVAEERLEWSAETARIHDEPDGFSPELADGVDYYAPEHRDRAWAIFRSCLSHGEPFDETLQILTAKGRRVSVRVTGEAERDTTGRIVSINGSFQDVSELVTVRERARESEMLLAIAGRAVKLGGWRVSLADQKVSWTDGTAAIHELPPGTPPTVGGGIDYFAPEEREGARKALEDCAKHGIPFDDVRDLITVKGNRVRVRSMGIPMRDDTGTIVAVQGAMQDITELTTAQRKAGELGRRLAQTLESIDDAFYTLDRDWRFTYLNSKAEVLLDRTRDSLIGRRIADEFPDIEGGVFEAQYIRALDSGETVRFEQHYGPLDRTFRVSAHPTPAGIAVYFSDITEERRQTENLRLLRASVDQISDIVIIMDAEQIDPDGYATIVYVNDAFERITGFSRDEAIGQTPRLLQGPKTDLSEVDRIHRAYQTKTPVRAELINYTKSGREYWLDLDIVPLADEAGSVTHFVAVQREITDRRRAEEALRISETRFRLIAEATGNAAWDWDIPAGRLWWSDGMERQFGHRPDPEGRLPTVWRENVHPEDEKRVDELTDRLLRGEIDRLQDRYRFRRADGTWTHVENHAFAIRDDDGRTVRILGSVSDISHRLEMEERLRQSQKLEAVGQLTGGVAHDFNNLLTIIMGNTEMLQDSLDEGDPLRRFADMSAVAADRGAELTNRLLAFSRKQSLQPLVIDINSVIVGIEDMLSRTLGEDVELGIELADELWPAEIDLAQLESALLNLAINSRDAMPDGGRLRFETANASLDHVDLSTEPELISGQYVVISVSDTGHGIPEDQIAHVFEPFFTTKTVEMGTGLGLSMVYGFVKQTGGYVRIWSEPGEGTTVKLYFPRYTGDHAAHDVEKQSERVQGGQETLLVVEDDTLILHQLTAQLTGLGYQVVTASAGGPALDILRKRSDIDLLFTDIVLPGGMNGRQIVDKAQKIAPGLKVLYTSGYSENTIAHQGRLDAEVELLGKPYRRTELAAKLRRVLDS